MDECQYIKIFPNNPNTRDIEHIVDIMGKGGAIIYPTDTVYGIGCDISNPKAVERIIRLKGLKAKEAHFSFICHDLAHIASYAKVSNAAFKLMKKNLPGPFTFILPGLNKVPEHFITKRKTVGIRVPNNNIILEMVNQLGKPILTTSIKDRDNVVEYTTNPDQIYEEYKHMVDVVIDGGFGGNIPSTVVDCTTDNFEVIRQGLGELV